MNTVEQPRISVVIPTYERRDVVLESVRALGRCAAPWPVEVVVVVDGSTDGTAAALRELAAGGSLPFPLRVVEQENAGAAAARNHGARLARGRLLLFLDDDMVADRDLLTEHWAASEAGADAVFGHIPLHADSPRTLLSLGVGAWATARRERLAAGGELTVDDLLTGQLSVRAEMFEAVGGFDVAFTRDGQFGGEDTDFGHRLTRQGATLRYAARAISHQRYVVTPQQYLRQYRGAGRADAMLALKHPELAGHLAERCGGPRWAATGRMARRVVPRRLRAAMVRAVVRRVEAGRTDALTRIAFGRVKNARYWGGWFDTAGRPGAAPPLRVLAFHAVVGDRQRSDDPYAVTATQLEQQLKALSHQGFQFLTLRQYLRHVEGVPVEAPSVLVTFDDGYTGVLEHAAPVLRRLGIPGVVFAVTGQFAGFNAWDANTRADGVPLLTVPQLLHLHDEGWDVQSHTRSHTHLPQLRAGDLSLELGRAKADLAAHGLGTPRAIAYPYGEHTWRVRRAAKKAGYRAAFALRTTRVTPGNRFALPRVEVRREHTAGQVVEMVVKPGREPVLRALRREVRGAVVPTLRAGLALGRMGNRSLSVTHGQ
ncbi:glycosyltransferase [Spongisporangium articulatum]|uniref:Glycosyltransferase n=1 Tax=Spongisporangium articulatum TaxID=3362603 RepID=A0ABW8AT87_9ACTN